MAARLAPASSASSEAEASVPWSSSTRILLARSRREVKVAGSGSRVTPVTAGRDGHRLQEEVGGFRRAVEGDGAGPGALGGGDVAGMRGLGAAQQRQIEEQHERLADDDGRTARRRAQGRRGAGVDLRIDAARLDVAGAVLADLGDAQQARAAIGGERDDVAGLQRQARGGKREGGALARGPGLEQPHLGHLRDLLGLQHQRQLGDGDAAAVAGETARLLDGSGIAAGRRDEGELGRGGKVRLLGAGERGERGAGAALDKGVGGQLGDGELRAAVGEDDAALALARVDEEGKLQRLQGLARGEHAVDEEAGERAGRVR